MIDMVKTGVLAAVALLLVVATVVAVPRHRAAEVFTAEGQGEPFYPDFKDPLKAAALEVIEYNETTAAATPFKVELKDGRWRIPSHHSYPADGKDRLAKTAASIMDLRKDVIRSTRPQDHEICGVIDPLDDKEASLKGRGKRVTLRDAAGAVLADYIFGKEAREGSGLRYVRLPAQKTVYAVKANPEISTRFEDWIETDLLKAASWQVLKIGFDSYSVDERTGRLKNRTAYGIARDDGTAPWKIADQHPDEDVNTDNVTDLTNALNDLKIAGVRPKPPGLSRELKRTDEIRLTDAMRISLAQAGFYVTEQGDLLSNEGEIEAAFSNGVVYTLRFGEVLFGTGEEITAGTPDPKKAPVKDPKEKKDGSENRYLMVTARYNEALAGPEPAAPKEIVPDPARTPDAVKAEEERYKKEKADYELKKKDREEKIAAGRKEAKQVSDRFADWYYVISADTFKRLRRYRSDLVKPKEEPKKDGAHKEGDGHDHK